MPATEKRTRVLICDDSAFMRKVLHRIISSDPGLEVVGEARDGRDVVSQAALLQPDVITMDINMPLMDGLQATELIMSSNPKPILIVSSESREGAAITLKALEIGAIDFIPKPSGGVDLDMESVRDAICRKLKMAGKVRVVRNAARSRLATEIATSAPRVEPGKEPIPRRSPVLVSPAIRTLKFPLVVIAASTGGPATLMKMMPLFPRNFPAAILLVQHMPATFTAQFSEQLNEVCALRVKQAEADEALCPGTVYVCPGGNHLRVSGSGRLLVSDEPRINGYRPCADVSMQSAAEIAGPLSVGVVLTGMGNDGVNGARAIREASGFVIAQDEMTSVIFGMNAEAIKAGVVDAVLPIDHVAASIEERVLCIHGATRVGAE
ncbi:MAG: protein-glutamate methylesterase/protein-glutamine glutaminase [Terriglobales bacterium]